MTFNLFDLLNRALAAAGQSSATQTQDLNQRLTPLELKPRLTWKVSKGNLVINGEKAVANIFWTLDDLEAAVMRLKQRPEFLSSIATAEVLLMEIDVAAALWKAGVITHAHLKNSTTLYEGITFFLEIGSESVQVAIVTQTQLGGGIEFVVNGLPGPISSRRVADDGQPLNL